MAIGPTPLVDYKDLIEEGRINGRLYYDPVIFQQEMEKIWHRGWVYVGHASEVPEPGDYMTRKIGQQPVIMVRDQDGEVGLLLNRCRHRGNLVCQHERGRAPFFRCDYHGWTYTNKGELIRVSYGEAYDASFRKEDHGLVKVARRASYRGFIFGSLSPTGISLEEHLGGAMEYIDAFVDRSLEGEIELRAGVQKARYKGNWKMLPENSLEGFYHGHVLHQYYFDQRVKSQTRREVQETAGGTVFLPGGHMVAGHTTRLHVDILGSRNRSGALADYVEAMERRFGKEKAQQALQEFSPFVSVFPNLILLQTHVRWIQPVRVNETYVYYQPALLKGAPTEVNALILRDHEICFGPAGCLAPDDLEILERIQAGIEARANEWLVLSRGLHREETKADGVRLGYGMDECQLRGMWRHYKSVMSEA